MARKKQPEEEKMATRKRIAELMEFLRSRTGNSDPSALVNYLNRNLPESKHFAVETVGRWEKGEQGILGTNIAKLARAIDVNENDLKQYIKGMLPRDRLFEAINQTEVPIDEAQAAAEILRLIHKLSPLFLVEVINKAWNILQEMLKSTFGLPVQQPGEASTIAGLVRQHRDDCVEMFDEIIPNPEGRVDAIISGVQPTEEELELISSATGTSLDRLRKISMEEFANGVNGATGQRCINRS